MLPGQSALAGDSGADAIGAFIGSGCSNALCSSQLATITRHGRPASQSIRDDAFPLPNTDFRGRRLRNGHRWRMRRPSTVPRRIYDIWHFGGSSRHWPAWARPGLIVQSMFEKEVSILLEKDVPDKPCHGSGDGGRFSAVLHPISRSLPLSDMTITFLVDSDDAFPPAPIGRTFVYKYRLVMTCQVLPVL
jgi:hypothetical protein